LPSQAEEGKKDKMTTKSIDEYIQQFPSDIQEILKMLRKVIKEAAPDAQEKISYQMPAFEMHGILVYFAACKKHIGFYPTASGIEAFKQELAEYKSSKGAVQFPIKKPIPYGLISKIVEFRVAENMRKAADKQNKKRRI
jgi:Uncharacterized conserved protein